MLGFGVRRLLFPLWHVTDGILFLLIVVGLNIWFSATWNDWVEILAFNQTEWMFLELKGMVSVFLLDKRILFTSRLVFNDFLAFLFDLHITIVKGHNMVLFSIKKF